MGWRQGSREFLEVKTKLLLFGDIGWDLLLFVHLSEYLLFSIKVVFVLEARRSLKVLLISLRHILGGQGVHKVPHL